MHQPPGRDLDLAISTPSKRPEPDVDRESILTKQVRGLTSHDHRAALVDLAALQRRQRLGQVVHERQRERQVLAPGVRRLLPGEGHLVGDASATIAPGMQLRGQPGLLRRSVRGLPLELVETVDETCVVAFSISNMCSILRLIEPVRNPDLGLGTSPWAIGGTTH